MAVSSFGMSCLSCCITDKVETQNDRECGSREARPEEAILLKEIRTRSILILKLRTEGLGSLIPHDAFREEMVESTLPNVIS